MLRPLTIFLLVLISNSIYSQSKDEILAEAYLLYKSEKASWNGGDMISQMFPDKAMKVGGYLSYSDGDRHKCIFYDREATSDVLVTIAFDDSFIPEAAKIDTVRRKMTSLEDNLYLIRRKAVNLAQTDTIFKHYTNANLNPIPLIVNKKKMVYFLTGTSLNDRVFFGNDYLVTFDKKDNIEKVRRLHKNIIPVQYSNDPADGKYTTIHSHTDETGDLITATDICTLMLYCPYTNWDKHIVISSKNVSVWDCHASDLFVITREAWEKISKDANEERKE